MREKLLAQIHRFFRENPEIAVNYANVKNLIEKDKSFNSKDAANKWFNRHKKQFAESLVAKNTAPKLQNELYSYTESSDEYVFYPEQGSGLVANFALRGALVRDMVSAYSNMFGEGESVSKISRSFGLPRKAVTHILKALEVTHDSPAWPSHLFDSKGDEFFVEYATEKRKFEIEKKISRANWDAIKSDAAKWQSFQIGNLDPFGAALRDFKTKDVPTVKLARALPKTGNVYVVNLTDLHIGDIYESAFSGVKYNAEIAAKKVDDIISQISLKIMPRIKEFKLCEVFKMGDILNSFADNKTRKGTEVRSCLVNEELFDFGLDVMIRFVKGLERIFSKVNINTAVGNHDSTLAHAMYRATEKYFSSNKNVTFNIGKEFVNHRIINGALFMFSHGGFDRFKANIPNKEGAVMDQYIHTFMLDRPDIIAKVKGRYFLAGHTHSGKQIERNHFEFFVVSAPVPSTEHSALSGYRNKSRTQCFVVSERGYIEEVHHLYLD